MKKHTASELLELYNEADSADKEVFAEMRSNILLAAGEHWVKKGSKFWNRIRDDKTLSQEQKLRITKNHIQKVAKLYSNQLISSAPGVTIAPQNSKEVQDQKAAELHKAVWEYGKDRHNLDQKIQDWADEFVQIAEVHVKLFFNPTAGDIIGYEQALTPDGLPLYTDHNGQDTVEAQMIDPMTGQMHQHQPKASDRAVFSGDVVFEPVYGFNLLRDPAAQSLDESAWVCIRKMVDLKRLKAMFPDGDERLKNIEASTADQTFVIFDAQHKGYRQVKGQVMLKEYYFRPCVEYPEGYFYLVAGSEAIVAEGPLPFGIWPIVSDTFDKHPTSPRGQGPIKTMRPYQIEINRCVSSLAEHQVLLGSDKLIMQAGSKISQAASIPGIRALVVTGAPPTILPGRDGSQYAQYMTQTIDELYQVMMVDEISIEKDGQLDPYAMLFRSASQKQRFNRYVKRFERFLKRVCETYLELQRNYMDESRLIPILGKHELVNVAEFKNSQKLSYQIKIEPQSEDIETKLGRQLTLNHLLQFTSGQLQREDIGKLYRLMPYGNTEGLADDLTIDHDNATNMILALDRGEMPEPVMEDNKQYMIRRLTARKRQADFKTLNPQVQANYDQLISVYQQMITAEMNSIKAAESDFIPVSQNLIGIDFYVTDPATGKTRRAKIPFESAQWLIKRLEEQGTGLQQLEALGQATQAGIANAYLSQGGQAGGGRMDAPLPAGANAMAQGAVDGNAGNGIGGNFDPSAISAGTSPE